MTSMFKGKYPDITPAQITAVIGWIVAQAVAFGWVESNQAQILISAGATIVAAAWKIADAFLRGKRAQALAGRVYATSSGPVTTTAGPAR